MPVPKEPTRQYQSKTARPNPKIDQSMPAFRIAQKFGGLSGLARAIKRAPQTVHRWLEKGYIPSNEQPNVLIAAGEQNIVIDPAEFVFVPEEVRTAND